MSSNLRNQFHSFRDGVARDRQRDLRTLSLLGRLLKYAIWIGVLALLALNLWTAWPNDLTGLSVLRGPHSPVLLFDVILFSIVIPNSTRVATRWPSDRSLTHMQAFTLALRNAIAARDGTVAPAAGDAASGAVSDAREPESAPVQEQETIAPLAHPLRSFGYADATYLLGVLASLALLGFGVWFMILPLFSDGPWAAEPLGWNVDDLTFPALFAIGGIVCLAWALMSWRWARRERRTRVAVVDAEGITVRLAGHRRRGRRLRWDEARGLVRVRYQDAASRTHTMYLLSTANEDLLWDVPPVSRHSPPYEIAQANAMRAAAQRLAEVVEQRTGLPLLDISGITRATHIAYYGTNQTSMPLIGYAISFARGMDDVKLATDLWRGTHPGAGEPPRHAVSRMRPSPLFLYTTPAQREEILRYALALLPYFPTSEQATPDARARLANQRRQQRERRQNGAAFALALGVTLLWGLGYGLQNWYAPPVLGALPAQTRAQTPIYLAPFGAPQSDWPTLTPVGADTRSAGFTAHGYELATHDPNQVVGVWTQFLTAGDSATQVTMRLTNAGPNADSAAGGILLNVSPDGSSALAFMIDQNGYVRLSRCHDLETQSGACDRELISTVADGMDTENGATTTLLVIQRGEMYFCYVNDTPVFVYRDTSGAPGDPAPRGYVGVYLDQGAATADFTNLSVYPAPPQLPFWAR